MELRSYVRRTSAGPCARCREPNVGILQMHFFRVVAHGPRRLVLSSYHTCGIVSSFPHFDPRLLIRAPTNARVDPTGTTWRDKNLQAAFIENNRARVGHVQIRGGCLFHPSKTCPLTLRYEQVSPCRKYEVSCPRKRQHPLLSARQGKTCHIIKYLLQVLIVRTCGIACSPSAV